MEGEEGQLQSYYNLDEIISTLKQGKNLPEKCILSLCEDAMQLLQNSENLLRISCPVTVCGDIHGYFNSLIEIFSIGGSVSDTNYLFLGNYINRGTKSIECISLLLALKLRYPSRINLLRGNHECSNINRIYGFYDECKKKYGSLNIWKSFNNVFQFLPLAAIIEDEVFCVHCGLSPDFVDVNHILSLKKVKSISSEQHLLWNDPEDTDDWWNNSNVGCQMFFGKQVTKRFLYQNNLKCMVRAHQVVMSGHELLHDDKLHTIFSTPNYLGTFNNKGSFIELDDAMNINIKTFERVKKSKLQNQ